MEETKRCYMKVPKKVSTAFIILALVILISALKEVSHNEGRRDINVCVGSAFSAEWEKKVNAYILQIFNATSLNVSLFRATPERAEYHFKKNYCQAFFASSANFNTQVARNIVAVNEPVLITNIELAYRSYDNFSSLKTLRNSHIVGVFHSKMLHSFVQKSTQASIVDLPTMAQGLKMLERDRLDAFIYPNIIVDNEPLLAIENELIKTTKIMESIKLYLWLNSEYEQQLEALEQAIKLNNKQTSASSTPNENSQLIH